MYYDDITAQDVLQNRRTQPLFEIPADISSDLSVPDAEHTRQALRLRLGKAGNHGFWKRLSALVLEPANPFNAKAPRRFRHDAIMLTALLLLAISIVAFFNLSAIVR